MSTMTDSDLKTRDSSSQDKDLEKHGPPTSVAVINASGHVSLMSFFLRRDFSGTSYLRESWLFMQVDQLQRQYGVLSICSTALTIGRLALHFLGYTTLMSSDTVTQIMRGSQWVGVSPSLFSMVDLPVSFTSSSLLASTMGAKRPLALTH